MNELERRFYRGELRAEGEQKRIIGYAAVFNSLSENLGGFREMIMPGAFKNALTGDVRALINHDPNFILGRTTSGTLLLSEDDIGLRYEIIPPDTQPARDLLTSIGRGDVDQSSFGFRVIEESWRSPTETEPYPVRILHEVSLFDVSPVTFPAYPATSVAVRAMAQQILQVSQAANLVHGQQDAAGRLALRRRQLNLLEIM